MAALFTLIFLAAIVGIFKPYVKGSKRWHFGLTAFISFIAIGVTAPASSDGNPAKVANVDSGNESDLRSDESSGQIEAPQSPQSRWVYQEDVDQMRGETSYYAQLSGTNTIDLDFPYGEQQGKVLIRQSPKFGFDILVGVESGQIMCSSYSDTYLNVKFDDGPIRKYRCTDASDGSNEMVFVKDARGFLANLKSSKAMIVEAEFFQNGLQQMTFDTAELEWEH